MKRFIISIISVSVFFLGLGTLAEKTGARFRSDEKALELIQKARVAIGGDSAIAAVKSMRIVGTSTRDVKVNGVDSPMTGETEIAMMLPDKLMRSIKIGHDDSSGDTKKIVDQQVNVVVVGGGKQDMKVRVTDDAGASAGEKRIVIRSGDGKEQVFTGAEADRVIAADGTNGSASGVKKIIIRNADGGVQELTGADADRAIAGDGGHPMTFSTKDGKTIVMTADKNSEMMREHHAKMRTNEILRYSLGLLLTAPQGIDVEYTSGGEADLDGTACNIVVASFGGQAFKLFLDRSSNLPVGMSYTGINMQQVMTMDRNASQAGGNGDKDVVIVRSNGGVPAEMTEIAVKFSDYRSVNGVQLPYRWTTTIGGKTDETYDVTNFEINPANIAEKFQNQTVMVRTRKPDGQ